MHQLTLEQFRISVETGAVLSVTIRALGAKFRIEAETRRGDATLITKRVSASIRNFAPRARIVTDRTAPVSTLIRNCSKVS